MIVRVIYNNDHLLYVTDLNFYISHPFYCMDGPMLLKMILLLLLLVFCEYTSIYEVNKHNNIILLVHRFN